MKRIIALIALSVAISTICYAQPNHTHQKAIEQFVSGLSVSQKKKIEQLHKQQHNEIAQLRMSQRRVRDSIDMYNDLYGDYSKILYPLYEREAKLQVEISKHFYEKKVALDKILTKEQHKEFIKNMEILRDRRSSNKKCK